MVGDMQINHCPLVCFVSTLVTGKPVMVPANVKRIGPAPIAPSAWWPRDPVALTMAIHVRSVRGMVTAMVGVLVMPASPATGLVKYVIVRVVAWYALIVYSFSSAIVMTVFGRVLWIRLR